MSKNQLSDLVNPLSCATFLPDTGLLEELDKNYKHKLTGNPLQKYTRTWRGYLSILGDSYT